MKYKLLPFIRTIILVITYSFLFYNCSKKESQKPQKSKENYFTISINTPHLFLEKAYLGKITNNVVKIVDTTKIKQGKCRFSGNLQKPQRMALFFDNTSTKPFIFLLENKNIQVNINQNNLSKGKVKNSPINDIHNTYQQKTTQIFQKINPFYFQLQQARLQNNVKKLKEINSNIIAIENEFLKYSFEFIEKHSSSYVSEFILKDLLQSSQIDSLTYQKKHRLIANKLQ